jgi:hypothetical protein
MGLLKPFGRHIKKGQGFGSNPFVGPNPAGGHNGDDWLTWVGEPVRAAGDYEVVFAGEFDSTYADNFGWNLNFGGNMVVLNIIGETAPYVEYGHLSELYVKTGDKGRRGDIIALTGNTDGGTNVSSGPHCHVGVLPHNFNLNTNTYGRVNPDLYLTDYWEDEADSLSYASESIKPIQEDEVALTKAQEKALDTIPMIVEMLNNIASGVNEVPGNVLAKEVPVANSGDKTSLQTFLSYAIADREATVSRIQSAIANLPASELAVQIDAAGLAEEVRNELVKLLSGKEG